MKRTFTILLVTFSLILPAFAQKRDMAEWNRQLRDFKHKFLAKELDLSREQQSKFFPIYDAMDDEIARVNSETREIENKVRDTPDDQLTDAELDIAIDAIFSQKHKEAEIEQRYLIRMREILSKRQMFKLQGAERKLNKRILDRWREVGTDRDRPHKGKKD